MYLHINLDHNKQKQANIVLKIDFSKLLNIYFFFILNNNYNKNIEQI